MTFNSRTRSGACAVALVLAAVPAAIPVARAGEAPIAAIDISGNTRITAETIAGQLGFAAGDAWSEAAADRALKTLFATGQYRDVAIRHEGARVRVTVAEAPILAGVSVTGAKDVAAKDVLAAATLKAGMPYTPAKARAEASRIVAMYKAQGRPETRVQPTATPRADGRIDLVLAISEGAVKRIDRIVLNGAAGLDERRLKDVMATTEAGWLDVVRSSSTLDESRFATDRALLLKTYRREGFADARIAEPKIASGAEGTSLVIDIEEGPRYLLAAPKLVSLIAGFEAASYADLAGGLSPGSAYDGDALDAMLERMAIRLAESGPAFAVVRLSLERDQAGRRVTPVFTFEPGRRLLVARIVISGNGATDERVIRAALSLAEGKPFSLALAKRDKARLEKLGLFKAVDIQTAAQPDAPEAVKVEVKVAEEDTRKIDWGIGYSSADGVMGDVSVTENNLLGTGTRLKAAIVASENRFETSLGFTEPHLFETPLAVGFDVLYRDSDRTAQSSYKMLTYGGDVRAALPLAENLTGSVRYGAFINEIHDVGPNASAAILQAIPGYPNATSASYLTSSIGTGLTYDTRDKARAPTTGTYLALTEDFAGVGGDVRYLKTTADARAYMPLSRDVTLGVRAVAGTIVGWGGDEVRLLDLFYKGGETVRGFAPSGIGPRDMGSANQDALGGMHYVAATSEARFALPYVPESTGLKGEVFADAGSLWGATKTAAALPGLAGATAAPRISVGAGLVWDSPLGAFRLDYAVPVVKQAFDKTQALSFGMVP